MSKARHLWWSVGLIPFILSDNKLFELYQLFLEVHCIRYEQCLFLAKEFPLLKFLLNITGWGAESTIFKVVGIDADSNLNPTHPDSIVLLYFVLFSSMTFIRLRWVTFILIFIDYKETNVKKYIIYITFGAINFLKSYWVKDQSVPPCPWIKKK